MPKKDLGKAVVALVNYDDDALLKQVAMRAEATKADPAIAGSYDPTVTYDFEHAGIADDLVNLGTRIFHRWELELHAVICGSAADDKKDRDSILSQLKADDATLGAAVGAVLIGLGVGPAVAAVLAALLLKRILKPAGNELCKYWSEQLAKR
jgi:hypothetical protein